MTSGLACAGNRWLGSRALAVAVVAGLVGMASTGVAHAQPTYGDGRDSSNEQCQATVGPPGVVESGQSTSDNAGNCGELPPPPVVIAPGSPLLPILCNAGAICVP